MGSVECAPAMRSTAMAYAVCVVVLAVFATAASEGDDRVVLLQEDGIPAPARMAAQKLWKQAAAMSDMRTGEFTKMQMPGQALKEAAVPNTAPSKPPAVAAVASAQKKIANAEQKVAKAQKKAKFEASKAGAKAAKAAAEPKNKAGNSHVASSSSTKTQVKAKAKQEKRREKAKTAKTKAKMKAKTARAAAKSATKSRGPPKGAAEVATKKAKKSGKLHGKNDTPPSKHKKKWVGTKKGNVKIFDKMHGAKGPEILAKAKTDAKMRKIKRKGKKFSKGAKKQEAKAQKKLKKKLDKAKKAKKKAKQAKSDARKPVKNSEVK